jgi:hypothetical protein
VQEAKSLRDLMRIRAYDSNRELLECINSNLGTALGFKKRTGEEISDEPAIIVFVPEKINPKWLPESQLIPEKLEGPDGLWCLLDVVEGGKSDNPEEVPASYDNLCEDLRGAADQIWVGSQISCWTGLPDPYLGGYSLGTIGAFARSRSGDGALGILTNAHVGMYPGTPLHHPTPSGIRLATTDKVSIYETDQEWYSLAEAASLVRTDCAFAKIAPDFDLSNLNLHMMGVGQLGKPRKVSLDDMSIIGQKVLRVGRTTGKRYGTIVAFGYEFLDFFDRRHMSDVDVCTDLLIVGDNEQPFSSHGDSGSLIVLDNDKKEPVGLLWGGAQEKLRTGYGQEKWTYGICLDRVLDALNIELVTDPKEILMASNKDDKPSSKTEVRAKRNRVKTQHVD